MGCLHLPGPSRRSLTFFSSCLATSFLDILLLPVQKKRRRKEEGEANKRKKCPPLLSSFVKRKQEEKEKKKRTNEQCHVDHGNHDIADIHFHTKLHTMKPPLPSRVLSRAASSSPMRPRTGTSAPAAPSYPAPFRTLHSSLSSRPRLSPSPHPQTPSSTTATVVSPCPWLLRSALDARNTLSPQIWCTVRHPCVAARLIVGCSLRNLERWGCGLERSGRTRSGCRRCQGREERLRVCRPAGIVLWRLWSWDMANGSLELEEWSKKTMLVYRVDWTPEKGNFEHTVICIEKFIHRICQRQIILKIDEVVFLPFIRISIMKSLSINVCREQDQKKKIK